MVEVARQLKIQTSIADFALVLAALAKPFARAAEILAEYAVTAEQLASARAHWAPILRDVPDARRAFSRAYAGHDLNPPDQRADETVMLPPRSPLMSAPAPLPFVAGRFEPEPIVPMGRLSNSEVNPDATQLGAALTDVTLPFLKMPLRNGAK